MTTSPELDNLITEINALIKTQEQALTNLEVIDLDPLENKAKQFIEIFATLPEEQADQYQEPVTNILNALNELGNAMSARQEDIKQQLDSLNNNDKAHKAYTSVQQSTPPPTTENNSDSNEEH